MLGVLTAPIGMMQQGRTRLAHGQGAPQGGEHELALQEPARRPAHQAIALSGATAHHRFSFEPVSQLSLDFWA